MNKKEKGVVLYITLVSLILISTLASFMLKNIISQSVYSTARLNRISAFYAVRSALHYGYDRLIYNDTAWTTPGVHQICNSNLGPCPPTSTPLALPQVVRSITVRVTPVGTNLTLSANVTYTAEKF